MSAYAMTDVESLLRLARAGSAPAVGQLLEGYRNYLTLLARVQIGRRLQGKVDADDLSRTRSWRRTATSAASRAARRVSWSRGCGRSWPRG